MSEFTPGPWILFKSEIDFEIQVNSAETPKDGGDIICEQPINYEASMRRWPANARLISQAPAMVKALEDLLQDTQHAHHNCGDDDCPVKRARTVLAAAKGE